MVDEDFKEIVLREKEQSIHISRVPTKIKELFIALSDEEFAKDYGMTLKWCLEQALEYQQMKPLIFNFPIEKSTASQEEIPDDKGKKMLSGRKVERRRN